MVGDDKVGVFDTGLGTTGALRRYIETYITQKRPMVSYATHGDLDHIGAGVVWMDEDDELSENPEHGVFDWSRLDPYMDAMEKELEVLFGLTSKWWAVWLL